MNVFIDQFIEEAHLGSGEQRRWHEWFLGERFVKVVEDHRGLDDRLFVVDQGRHDGVGIKLHVGRVELIAPQRHQMLLVREPLFRQSDPRLLGANGIDAVV